MFRWIRCGRQRRTRRGWTRRGWTRDLMRPAPSPPEQLAVVGCFHRPVGEEPNGAVLSKYLQPGGHTKWTHFPFQNVRNCNCIVRPRIKRDVLDFLQIIDEIVHIQGISIHTGKETYDAPDSLVSLPLRRWSKMGPRRSSWWGRNERKHCHLSRCGPEIWSITNAQMVIQCLKSRTYPSLFLLIDGCIRKIKSNKYKYLINETTVHRSVCKSCDLSTITKSLLDCRKCTFKFLIELNNHEIKIVCIYVFQ